MNDQVDVFSLNGVALLDYLGVIKLEGEDAAKFIHAQLSQDFVLLDHQTARLAAFCSAKGRMQASFIGFKQADNVILLICSRDLLASTLKRLSMFVLRAKVKLSDATHEFALYGLAADAVLPSENLSPWCKHEHNGASVVNLYPAMGSQRQMWVGPHSLARPAGAALSLPHWLWGEVRSAVATLSTPVIDMFVPQMLNYESIGGVNFKKGCYPGQEVVARSQFRGTLKRRAFVAHCSEPMQPGDEVFHSSDADQAVGLVVQSASAPMGGHDAIISLQLATIHDGTLHARAPQGPEIRLLSLPYELLEDV